jgi:transcriptional regulator with XRE-family HTH domain
MILDLSQVSADNGAMGAKRRKMSDRIRKTIESATVSRYRIAKDTGIDEATLSRFVAGKSGLSMEALDALFEYFDLDVVQRRKKRS